MERGMIVKIVLPLPSLESMPRPAKGKKLAKSDVMIQEEARAPAEYNFGSDLDK